MVSSTSWCADAGDSPQYFVTCDQEFALTFLDLTRDSGTDLDCFTIALNDVARPFTKHMQLKGLCVCRGMSLVLTTSIHFQLLPNRSFELR